MARNDFTRQLLNYSAERDDSIGRPERWGDPPPLVVSSTPLHAEMAAFANELWTTPTRPIWYFLVGGPGNGKSEAVGAFVRQLNKLAEDSKRQAVFDVSKGRDGGSISYWFHEPIPGGEVTLLQDVSVPKTSGSDPAEDVLASLTLCAESGGHLLACANRGMLLRATRIARRNVSNNWLTPILQQIDQRSQEVATADTARWTVIYEGKTIEIRVWPLDHESILHGSNTDNPWTSTDGSLLDHVVQRSVGTHNWEDNGCNECAARQICPMFADAVWLRDDPRRRSFLKILRHAEVWSGQRLVLREALGLLSTVLVGTPSDFVESDREVHPCDWVSARITGSPPTARDDRSLMELLAHRIYQDLFGRSNPTGLSLGTTEQHRDNWVTERITVAGPLGRKVSSSLRDIDRNFAKQAGPLRLVGDEGILQNFDPAIDDAWCYRDSLAVDGPIAQLRQIGAQYQSDIEIQLADLLHQLESGAAALMPHEDPAKTFAAIYRWASTIFVRLIGTALGEIPNSDSISDFLNLLAHPARPLSAGGQPTMLRDLMQSVAGSENRIELAPSFFVSLGTLRLRAIGARSRSVTPAWPANDRLTLLVSTTGDDSERVLLTAATFVDAWRKHVLKAAPWNISPAMDDVMRSWRDDFMVTRGLFRNREELVYEGSSCLQFEFVSPTELQVRETGD